MIRHQRPTRPPTFAQGVAAPRRGGTTFNAKVWQDHKAAFSQAQHGKCGYCETKIAGSQDADVEHYAPKAAVHHIGDDPSTWGREQQPGIARLARGSRRTEPVSNTGFWWRAYDWTNYLFACSVCNSKYKGNVFPLDPRPPSRWSPAPRDSRHRPLLLSCYDDDRPWHHFRIDPISATVTARTRRGVATIATCGLHRETLRAERLEPVREAVLHCREISAASASKRSRSRAWQAVAELGNERKQHAGAVRAVAEELLGLTWDEIVAYVRHLPAR